MPLTDKGRKIFAAMREYYGAEKGRRVFYASRNKGTITGVDRRRHRPLRARRRALRARRRAS